MKIHEIHNLNQYVQNYDSIFKKMILMPDIIYDT
jgi:hypothetical protein